MADEILELGRRRGARDEGMGFLPLLLLGAGGVGLYYLLRPRGPGVTVPGVVPPVAPPTVPPVTVAGIDQRFSEVRELYRMGRLTPDQALLQAENLRRAANAIASQDAVALAARIAAFQGDVAQFAAQFGGATPA